MSWSISPGAIALLLIVTGWYVHRWWTVREDVKRLVLFLSGILVTAAALLSPIDIMGEQLFFMHMVQHLLLLDIAAILIILGLTRKILRPLTKQFLPIERKAGFFATPVFAITLYVLVMWVWHIPAMYDAALEHSGVHVLEHLTFAFAGGLYWWHIFSPIRPRHKLIGLGAAGYMASTKVMVGLLGVFLTFSPDSFYAFYDRQPEYWGLTSAEDQAIGGAIMTLEQMIVMGAAFAWLFIRMLTESNAADMRAERFGSRTATAEPADAPAVPRLEVAFDPRAGSTPLSTAPVRAELDRLGVAVHEGLRVQLVSGAAEVDAVARWDAEWGGFVAHYAAAPSAPAIEATTTRDSPAS
jgi:cytochrome c oxidase assembly factor CtaG